MLVVGGAIAGFVNTLAGGGSFLTVPLLIFVGVPATVANATNRVGVFVQSAVAVAGFRQEGVGDLRGAARSLPAILIGSWCGAYFATNIPDEVFERAFGVVMLVALPVIVWNPKPGREAGRSPLPGWVLQLVYLGIGLYGGAVQAGIGIPLLLALAAAGGLDLVRANAAKVAIVAALTLVALAWFVVADKVLWGHGITLALGTGVGGYAASRFGARVGERLVRPVLTLAVIALALRLIF